MATKARSKTSAARRPAARGTRRAAAKRKATAHKSAGAKATRPAARKAPARKAPARKPVARAAKAGRKAAARKTVKAAAKRPAVRKGVKAAARKAPAKSVPRKGAAKAAARRAPARKAATRGAPRKATAGKSAVRKPAAGKVAARKGAAKKPAARKAPARPAPRPAPAGAPTAVGFIGLGTMGMPQALNLAKAGRRVLVYDSNPAAMQAAARHPNVVAATSPRAVAEGSAVVFTCLPDDAAVGQVFRGEEGLLRGLRQGLLTCDLSTVSPEFTERLDAELRAAGVTHFTAPMLGSKAQAEAGQVFYILGGPAGQVARLAPYLAQAGRRHIHVGSAPAANKIKLLHNALGSVNYAAVAEALALCTQSGVSLQTFYDVVRSGGGMAFGNYFERKVPTIIKGDYTPRFKLKLAHKDSQLAKTFFAGTGVPAPIHEAARRLLEEGLAAGYGEEDASAVTRVIERRIGRRIVQD